MKTKKTITGPELISRPAGSATPAGRVAAQARTLESLRALIGARIVASDDGVGTARDFLFDDTDWAIRYVVADTGRWLAGRKTLIPVASVQHAEAGTFRSELRVNLSKAEIETAPPLDADAPISRQYDRDLCRHFKLSTFGPTAEFVMPLKEEPEEQRRIAERIEQSHLRSANEVIGYAIQATDGEIGHVEDLLATSRFWSIRFLVVDTKNWWPGKKVVISPRWAVNISWPDETLTVQVERQRVQAAPEYNPDRPLPEEYESQVQAFYGLPEGDGGVAGR